MSYCTQTYSHFNQCGYFDASDDLNNKTIEMVAQKLAKFHALVISFPKEGVKQSMDGTYIRWFDDVLRHSYSEAVVRKETEKQK